MTFTERVAAHFKAHPLLWIDAIELESVGGRQAWRTRVAEVRKQFQAAGEGTIENRTRRQRTGTRTWTLSQYRYIPDVSEPTRPQGHDVGFDLR